MDASNDKMRQFSNDNTEINEINSACSFKKDSELRKIRKDNSPKFNESSFFQKKIRYQMRKNNQEEEKNEEIEYNNQNIAQKINQKNEMHKSLSDEQLQNVNTEHLSNPSNRNVIRSISGEINSKILSDLYDDLGQDLRNNDIFRTQKEYILPNTNSDNSKEFQIIDKNMKSLFFNPSKSNENTKIKEAFVDYELIEKTPPQSYTQKLKNGNAIRNSYIQKLVSTALYLPNNRPKTHNSLIIFDWDDTLLPTSYLTKDGPFNPNMIINEADQKKISKLEKTAYKILEMAISKGDTYIITNAGLDWVEYSAQKFYPKLHEILPKINIISARGEWEKTFPGDIRKWKIQTFLSLQERLDTKLVTNIICLGDSFFEIEAGRVLANCFREAFVKTIKFKEMPKLEELNKQLIVVINQFNSICSAVKNLTIRVEKKK